MDEHGHPQRLDRLPERVELAVVDSPFEGRGDDLEPPEAKLLDGALHLRDGIRRERVVVGEPHKPLRVASHDAGKAVIAAASREGNAIDTEAVQLRQPSVRLLVPGALLLLRLGKVPGQPPGGAVALGPHVRDLLGLRCARDVEGLPAAGRVALHGEVRVAVDDVQVLEHRLVQTIPHPP